MSSKNQQHLAVLALIAALLYLLWDWKKGQSVLQPNVTHDILFNSEVTESSDPNSPFYAGSSQARYNSDDLLRDQTTAWEDAGI